MSPAAPGRDVVVVGGGPAGAAFAATLRALAPELDLLVLDRATFPRDKVCGDALTYRSLPLLREIFPALDLELPSPAFTRRQTLVYPNGAVVRRAGQELDVVPRAVLDAALWRALGAAGVEALDGAEVHELVRDGSRVAGVRVRRGGRSETVRASLVVGADGSGSVVRRRTGPVSGDRTICAVRQYVADLPAGLDGLHFLFDLELNGYFWVFPFVRDGSRWANVGYGNSTSPRTVLPRFEELLATPRVRDWLGGGRRVGRPCGFPLNLAAAGFPRRFDPARELSGEGYLLLGDAAALIHPLSGEGIAFALKSGEVAARVLADARIPPERRGEAYRRELLRWALPLYGDVGSFLAIRVPVLLPGLLSRAYVRGGSWLQRLVPAGSRT